MTGHEVHFAFGLLMPTTRPCEKALLDKGACNQRYRWPDDPAAATALIAASFRRCG